MKSYHELKAEMETIQQLMVEAKKSGRIDALKKLRNFAESLILPLAYPNVHWLKTGRIYEY